MPFDGSFDATQFEPSQGGQRHPTGKYPATISNTTIKPTKSGDGGLFEVEFTTPAGTIANRYNLWNKEPKAVEIAHKELSALCYATGIFKLDFRNDAVVLRNARCMIEVGEQKDKEGKATGYVEVTHVYDANGNEPGKQAQSPQPQQQASQGNAGGGWGNPNPPANPNPPWAR